MVILRPHRFGNSSLGPNRKKSNDAENASNAASHSSNKRRTRCSRFQGGFFLASTWYLDGVVRCYWTCLLDTANVNVNVRK